MEKNLKIMYLHIYMYNQVILLYTWNTVLEINYTSFKKKMTPNYYSIMDNNFTV